MSLFDFKPCPFCGSDKIHLEYEGKLFFVTCYDCCARTAKSSVCAQSADEAISKAVGKWNRRDQSVLCTECTKPKETQNEVP